MMDVAVVGTGYVGLVTGACLAEIGHRVICVDNNRAKVESLQQGHIPIYEPGLEPIVRRCTESGRLHFTTDLQAGVEASEIIFIAVGTPALPTGDPDLRYVEAVAREVGQHLDQRYRVIVNKSTVPIGSGDWVRMIMLDGSAQRLLQNSNQPNQTSQVVAAIPVGIAESEPAGESTFLTPTTDLLPAHPELAFDVVSNPEFLREGSAIWDTFNPDRIVVGSDSSKAIEKMRQLYSPILNRELAADRSAEPVPFVVTDLASAEMIKYAANAFLATKISFINEIANICERVGADVTQVAKGIGLDSRIGSKFLNAGLGWGGSCFPKDISALQRTASDYGYDTRILNAVIAVNRDQRHRIVEKLQHELKVLKGKIIGLLGLTFKPNTDDMRDAPSLSLIQQLSKLGAKVKAYDPVISASGFREGLTDVYVEMDVLRLAHDCDALVLVTEWHEFQTLDFAQLAGEMRRPLMVDGRNFLDPKVVTQAGFYYVGVGR